MTDRDSFHEVMMLALKSDRPFTPVKEYYGTKEECMARADAWASEVRRDSV